ncbi:MAG TPA: potassium transporter TrkG [Bacteroidales bacterium]|nr:potassium transporter TrkG [Bacteroidales bacterium]
MNDSGNDSSEKSLKEIVKRWFQIFSFLISLSALLLVIYEVGFSSPQITFHTIKNYYFASLILFLLFTIGRYMFFFPRKQRKELWFFDLIFVSSIIILIIKKTYYANTSNEFLLFFEHRLWIYFLVFYSFYKELSLLGLRLVSKHFNPALIFVISFLIIIISGTLLLLLPNATTNGISFMDSLFTSTSAVCVTGLTVVDTEFCFTFFGKIIILGLIQAGGLGIMTFTSYFSYFFKGKPTYHSQLMLSDMVNSESLSELFDVIRRIILVTLSIEATGALLIFFQIPRSLGMSSADMIFFSVFHSVSAFCNAGFSTLSDNFHDINFRFNYPVHLIISFLIIFGGLGFPIILNFLKYFRHLIINRIFRLNKRREFIHKAWVISINTRIVTITTFVLLVVGTFVFLILEYHNTLSEHQGAGKLVTSFFSIVSPRTAGFNSINYGVLHVSTILFIILLMWIGASPASTGGGIKTSSFALSLLTIFSLAKGKDRVEVFGRQIADSSIRRTSAIIFLSFIIIGISVFCVSLFDPEKNLLDIVFECFSAYGTVGLSLGITPHLSEASKLILTITMFLGRLGTLTVLIAFFKKIQLSNYHYPIENILIN